MKVVYGIGNLSREKMRPRVVAVGVFDGVHRGHKKVLKSVIREARLRGHESCVVTFSSHPSHHFPKRENQPAITSLEHKLMLMEKEGIALAYVFYFNKKLANMAPCDFIKKVLLEKIGMESLYVGEDFIFGKGGRGDTLLLKKLSSKFGFRANILKHLKIHNRIVSSTLIRALIKDGILKSAELFLGRRVSFLGKVIKGEGRGRTLGFPTANIEPRHEALVPDGIYASFIFHSGRKYRGLAYFGTKPTFNKKKRRTLEVYIFGLRQNLYGKILEVQLVKKLREDLKFSSSSLLVAQINRDVAAAQAVFKNIS